MAELYERVDISNDVSIQRGPSGVSIRGYNNSVYITDAELPALIAALQDAAEAMGVTTGQGEMVQQRDELVAALTALREEYFNLIVFLRMHHIQIADAALEQAQQALASVK